MKKILIIPLIICLSACGTGIATHSETPQSKPVSSYARKNLYYLGDLIDEMESLSIARNGSVAARLDDVEMAYDDYKRSRAYEKYAKKKKNKKQLEEFKRISKIRDRAMKSARKIIETDDYESEGYAEKFMDEYENSKDESFISRLRLKYSQ